MTQPVTDLLSEPAVNTAVAQLVRAGVTDSDGAATRIARALAKHGFTPAGLPTSAHGDAITAVMCELKYTDRSTLGVLIARDAGTPGHGTSWPDFLVNAFDYADNCDQIAATRTSLNEALRDAEQAIFRITKIREQLAGPLYDVEHAEGGDLFTHHLTTADRAIRTAALVNPTRGQ